MDTVEEEVPTLEEKLSTPVYWGKIAGLTVQELPPSMFDECLLLIKNYLIPEEAMCYALDIKSDPESCENLLVNAKDCMRDGTSIVVFKGEDYEEEVEEEGLLDGLATSESKEDGSGAELNAAEKVPSKNEDDADIQKPHENTFVENDTEDETSDSEIVGQEGTEEVKEGTQEESAEKAVDRGEEEPREPGNKGNEEVSLEGDRIRKEHKKNRGQGKRHDDDDDQQEETGDVKEEKISQEGDQTKAHKKKADKKAERDKDRKRGVKTDERSQDGDDRRVPREKRDKKSRDGEKNEEGEENEVKSQGGDEESRVHEKKIEQKRRDTKEGDDEEMKYEVKSQDGNGKAREKKKKVKRRTAEEEGDRQENEECDHKDDKKEGKRKRKKKQKREKEEDKEIKQSSDGEGEKASEKCEDGDRAEGEADEVAETTGYTLLDTLQTLEEGGGRVVAVMVARVVQRLEHMRSFSRIKVVQGVGYQKWLALRCHLQKTANLFEEYDIDKYYRLYHIVVHPDHRKKGVATFLLRLATERLAELFAGPATVCTAVTPSRKAQRLVARAGFRPQVILKYQDWKDERGQQVIRNAGSGNYNVALTVFKVSKREEGEPLDISPLEDPADEEEAAEPGPPTTFPGREQGLPRPPSPRCPPAHDRFPSLAVPRPPSAPPPLGLPLRR